MKNLKILKKKIKIDREIITIKLPFFIVIIIFLYVSLIPPFIFIRKGTELNKDLISPRTIEIVDEEATQKEIEKALENAPIFYEYNPDIDKEVLSNFEELSNYLRNWREGDKEVDFILTLGDSITAIEVKSGHESPRRSGLDSFISQFHPQRILLVGKDGLSLSDFLQMPLKDLL